MLYSPASKNQYVQFLRLRGGRPPSDSIYMYLYFSWFCREVFKCVLSCRRLAGRSHGGVRMSGSSHGGGGRTLPAWTGPGLPAWQWGSVKCPHHTVRAKVLKLVVSVSREAAEAVNQLDNKQKTIRKLYFDCSRFQNVLVFMVLAYL